MHMPWCAVGCQRPTSRTQFSRSTMWVPRIKLIIWLGSKCLYPLNHFAGLICELCFLYVRMHAHHTHGCLQRPEEGIRSHGAAVPGGVRHLTWEQSVGPLEGQRMLLTAEPSL